MRYFLIMFILSLGIFPILDASAQDNTEKPLITVVESIDKVDSLIDVSLLGTLAGLSLASASLLLSGRGQIESQRNDEEIRLINEQNDNVRKKLQNNLNEIEQKRKYVQSGIQYLVKAFFLFIADLVGLLLFFDSFYEKSVFSSVQNEIIVIVFEVLPFLVGLGLLVLGAERIRLAYTK